MALNAATVWEVRTAGNDTNGGGFVIGGTDFSQQDAKNTVGNDISTTDAVAVGTGVITSATATFTSAIVGNIIYLQGGTGALAAGWYQVTSHNSGTSITVDRNVAAGTGITMNIGGALASPGMAGGVGLVTGHTIHVKSGTYPITSATINVSGGCPSVSVLTTWIGYGATRNDYGTPPLLQASGISTFIIFTVSGSGSLIANLRFDGASLTSSQGCSVTIRATIYKCSAENCTNRGFSNTAGSPHFVWCQAKGCTTTGAGFYIMGAGVGIYDCESYDNSVSGCLDNGNGNTWDRCLAYGNTGATSDGFQLNITSDRAFNCTSYGNGRDGFRLDSNTQLIINCLAEANTGYGFNISSSAAGIVRLNCGTFNNTAGATNGVFRLALASVVGTSSFFTNAAADDFSLNNTAGGGAAARAAGIPGVFPAGLTTGYLDIGAAQHGDPASSGGQSVSIFGGP